MFFAVTEMRSDDLVEYTRVAPGGEAYKELMAISAGCVPIIEWSRPWLHGGHQP
jgi:hypothetical protein